MSTLQELDAVIMSILFDYRTGSITISQAMKELKQAFEYYKFPETKQP
jgi:hypothetical protein